LEILSKNLQISNFMIILAVGAEFLRADGEKNRHDENNSRFFFPILRTCLKNEFLLITYLWLSRNSKNKQVSVVGPCNGDNVFSVRCESA